MTCKSIQTPEKIIRPDWVSNNLYILSYFFMHFLLCDKND